MIVRTKTYLLILILLGLLVYFNSLFNGFFLSDDEDQIINNPLVYSLENIPKLFKGSTYYRQESDQSHGPFYRPLMIASFTITYSLFGPDPLFFHLFQILLHTTNALLVFFLFKKFFQPPLAFILASIFLVHPINSEIVLHAANTQEVLFLFFGLSAFHLASYRTHPTKPWLITAYTTSLLLALFGKETAAVFAVMIPFYIWLTHRSRFLPILFSSFTALITYLIFRTQIANIIISHQPLAAFGDLALPARLLHAPAITASYLTTYFFPRIILNGYHWTLDSPSFNNFILPLLTIVLITTILIVHIHRTHRHSKKPAHHLLFFLIWFWLALSLHLHFIALETTLTDRWFYLPQIGLLGIIGYLLTSLSPTSFVYKKSAILTFTIILALSARTFIRTFDWRTSESLILNDLSYDTNNYYFQNLLGSIYIENGQLDLAAPRVMASVAIRPNFGNLNNLAIIHLKSGNLKQADYYFQAAINQGLFYTSRINYANFLLYYQQDFARAQTFAADNLKLYPQSSDLWLVLAQAHYHQNHQDDALAAAQIALELKPHDFSYHVFSSIKNHQPIDTSSLHLNN